ncbi:hypothetical protein MPER_13076 [Moniliophthora perniciosa FA553]|nr:hypothetical protein MPER_13076 [Moniliophthora perniciosa FA553]
MKKNIKGGPENVFYRTLTFESGNPPPGPKGYPLVGNIFQIDANQLWNTLLKWEKDYGDIVYFRLFNQNIVVLNSGRVAGDLLDRRAANYSEQPRMPVDDYLTGGLNMVALHATRGIQYAIDILDDADKWRAHTHQFTSSGVASLIYSDQSSNDGIVRDLSGLTENISAAMAPGNYLANHISILEHVPDFLAKWKREMKAKYCMYTASLLKYFLTIKQTMPQKQELPSCFCSMLVETHERHGLDDLGSAWLAAILYLAGYDTTTTTLQWLIIAMISYPEVQLKAQEELNTVIGRSRIPTLQDMDNLPYVRAVVKEVLRWRPPAPIGVAHASLEVMSGSFPRHYYGRSWILTNILSMNHDTATYGPDPDVFRPERFLNEDGTHKPSPPDTKDEGHYSFGFGRRICPGRHLASNTLLTFATVLWATRLEPGKDASGREVPQSTREEGSGIVSRPPACKVSSRPRFPGAQDILKLAKEEWI